jgi:hypothetical protein
MHLLGAVRRKALPFGILGSTLTLLPLATSNRLTPVRVLLESTAATHLPAGQAARIASFGTSLENTNFPALFDSVFVSDCLANTLLLGHDTQAVLAHLPTGRATSIAGFGTSLENTNFRALFDSVTVFDCLTNILLLGLDVRAVLARLVRGADRRF